MHTRHSYISGLALASLVTIGLTGCGDIEQNLWIHADGSGKLETSFNLGEMMSMIKGFSPSDMMDTTMSPPAETEPGMMPKEPPKDPMEEIINQVTSLEYDRDFDTLISYLSLMPDSVKEKETRLDLAEQIAVRIKSPAKSSDLVVGLLMQFKDQAELQELAKYMETLNDSSNIMTNASPGGIQSETFLVFEADLKAGWIKIDSVDYSGVALEYGMTGDSLMNSEELGMMEMMFGSTKIKSVIHVPGEVTSCTHKDAILTKDNKVIVEYGFLDAVKKGKTEAYTIYFNPKK